MDNASRAQKVLDALKEGLSKDDFDDGALAKRLADLKVIARMPLNAPGVYTKDGLDLLGRAAFGQGSDERPATGLEAGRIIANALLLQQPLQQVFSELGHIAGLVKFYAHADWDREFVGARILFLLTYKSKTDFVALIESQGLVDHIDKHLSGHNTHDLVNTMQNDPRPYMALVETLKLLYNLASKYPGQSHFFSPTVNTLINIARGVQVTPQPLDPPVSQLLNALAVVEWPLKGASNEPSGDSLLMLARLLVKLLDQSTSSLKPAQLETMLIPLVTVLRKVVAQADDQTNTLLRISLLPQDDERDKPLGQSLTLASRLLRLQTSAGLSILPEAISGLFFDLSDKDATKFVHNIGYGHAAGYLMTHKIPIPEGLSSGTSTSQSSVQINPITGQRLDAETPITMPEMTEVEKEREAERLFVLFERLKATGVIDVENPLREAQHSGRFEELSDDD